jgi:leucyl aminopeptidase
LTDPCVDTLPLMVNVEITERRSRSLPFAFPVLDGREAATPGFQAALNRGKDQLDRQGFTGKVGQVADLDQGLIAVGLGEEASADTLRWAAGSLARHLGTVERIGSGLHDVDIAGSTRAVVEGLILGGYTFGRYKSSSSKDVVVELPGADSRQVAAGQIVSEAEVFARDLINTPAGDKAPEVLARLIAEQAAAVGVRAEIWDEGKIAAERLNGLLSVAAGSHRPPRFVRLSYLPRRAERSLALVGKGIVFDSGGLSLKTAEGMETMKTDMSGAAAAAAAMLGAARLKLPINLEAYLPLTENMPGGGATRPGDVITYRNGRTVEVLNTDAEGRLVLADGLILAAEGSADLIVDIATLTGAQRIALGDRVGAALGSEQADVELLVAAGAVAGERFWPMPLVDDYSHLIRSDLADVKNTGGRYGGVITAALIMRPFVDGKRWVHLDIAGPARAETAYAWFPKGGTGFGTRTLIALAELMTQEKTPDARRQTPAKAVRA